MCFHYSQRIPKQKEYEKRKKWKKEILFMANSFERYLLNFHGKFWFGSCQHFSRSWMENRLFFLETYEIYSLFIPIVQDSIRQFFQECSPTFGQLWYCYLRFQIFFSEIHGKLLQKIFLKIDFYSVRNLQKRFPKIGTCQKKLAVYGSVNLYVANLS